MLTRIPAPAIPSCEQILNNCIEFADLLFQDRVAFCNNNLTPLRPAWYACMGDAVRMRSEDVGECIAIFDQCIGCVPGGGGTPPPN